MADEKENLSLPEMTFDSIRSEIVSNLESVDLAVEVTESGEGKCRLTVQARSKTYELLLEETG